MQNTAAENWFQSLKSIWINKDIEHVGSLLSSNFQYYENPFEPPLTSLDEIKSAWKEVSDQDIIKLEISPLVSRENEGSASYEFSYKDTKGNTHSSQGAYYVKLDDQRKAIEFRQWWVNR
jgi:hypothetical protein